ncbi:putative Lipoprotein [metagenome]|uniref:Putative Lipoprotein n=1 Tax=metagenome TaxID=256318 RepID=A0A2P2BZD7_9ZZZZ
MTPASTRRLAAITLLATLGLTFAACTGAGSDSASSDGDAGVAAAPEADRLDAPADGFDSNTFSTVSDAANAEKQAPEERSVISTSAITLRGDDVQGIRDDVADIVAAHGGTIADERSASSKGSLRTSRLVIRVPGSDFEATLDELKKAGKVDSFTTKAEDVTTQVIDTRVRVAAQVRSIKRITELLDQAQSIRTIMAIEAQLTRRQAALDSLQAQQAWLADQTTQATISVEINRTDVPVVEEEKDRGFLTGLSAGWSGLKTFVLGSLTVLGAVLPFAVLIAVLGIPAWFVLRRFVRRPEVSEAP